MRVINFTRVISWIHFAVEIFFHSRRCRSFLHQKFDLSEMMLSLRKQFPTKILHENSEQTP